MYHPYRGKRADRMRILKAVLIAILCIFIIACIIFLLFFQNKDTSAAREPFRWPWSSGSGEKPKDDINFEIVGNENGDPLVEPTPAPVAEAAAKVLEIPADKSHDAAYIAEAAKLAARGFNTAAITVKGQDGAVTGVDGLKTSLDTLRAAGMKTVAVFYAYEDNDYAKQTPAAALKNKDNQAWKTGDGLRWLDPASEEANAYLLGNIRACKNAGFDEIQLRSFAWPSAGRLDRINYGASDTGAKRADLLVSRLNAVITEAAPSKVAVVLDNPTVEGGLSEASGQDAAKLYAAAAKLYVPMAVQTATSGDSIRTIVGKTTGGDTAKIVPMYTSAALAPALLTNDQAFYFSPAESGGALTAFH